MLYLSIFILTVLILIYILSVKQKSEIPLNNLDKKEHKLIFLYPMAAFLTKKTGLDKILRRKGITNKIRALYVSDQENIHTIIYLYKKISLILSVIFISAFFSLLLSIQYLYNSSAAFDGVLIRPKNKTETEIVRLKFRLEHEENNKTVYEDEISVQNSARSFSDEEWEQVLKEAIPYLEQEVLGENENLSHIYSDLNFIDEIPETGISVEWLPEDYRLITESGTVKNDDLTEKRDTSVTAILKYRDKKTEHTIPLTVWPPVTDGKDKLYKELNKAVTEADRMSEDEKTWKLPERIGNYIVRWEKPVSNSAGPILALGLLASALLWYLPDMELENRIQKRNRQMLRDYPEIINKFSLLINAGMTIRQAWFHISEDYLRKKNERKGEIRYAYEEMAITLHELKFGIPEALAYEQFGQRAGLLQYMKFSSLLVQNLKKGNKDMVNLLKTEAMEAVHERKETVKKLGEEASTKLLLPMVIMLFIVLVIIMVPAFMSFGI